MSPPLTPWPLKLRDWQEKAFHRFRAHTGSDFLIMATPGAGKTRVALRIAHELLSDRLVGRLLIICPTNHLRRQWAAAAHHAGVALDPSVTNEQGREATDYHGAVVTYHQVCLNPDMYRLACRQVPTLVIFDELHHAADGKEWGTALREAFDPAPRRLALSGTPFRSDNHPIPFVTYVNDQSLPDFSYGYAQALAETVCRPIVFPTYEGDLTWLSDGREFSAGFMDGLGRTRQRERLKAALLHQDWLGQVIGDADRELLRLRAEGHPAAGGLIIAMNQDHAGQVAAHVRTVTRTRVRVAVSDDPSASTTIQAYATSRDRWLVAVNMVSEGIDIPRLRVGIYATNVQTEMYFRQVVGRFVRSQPELPANQRAYLYLPGDPRLIEYADHIKAERDHVLQERLARDAPRFLFDAHRSQATEFMPLRGVARPDRRIGDEPTTTGPDGSDGPLPAQAAYEQKDQLRGMHKSLVAQVARRAGVEHRRIHLELVKRTGSRIESATIPQLTRRIKQLEKWLERGYDERR